MRSAKSRIHAVLALQTYKATPSNGLWRNQPKGQAPSNLINAGAYVLSPEVFTYIPEGRAVSMEREVFPKLAEEGKLCGHCINGLWIDIGKPQEYLEANKIVLDSISKNVKQENPASFELKNPVALDDRRLGRRKISHRSIRNLGQKRQSRHKRTNLPIQSSLQKHK